MRTMVTKCKICRVIISSLYIYGQYVLCYFIENAGMIAQTSLGLAGRFCPVQKGAVYRHGRKMGFYAAGSGAA